MFWTLARTILPFQYCRQIGSTFYSEMPCICDQQASSLNTSSAPHSRNSQNGVEPSPSNRIVVELPRLMLATTGRQAGPSKCMRMPAPTGYSLSRQWFTSIFTLASSSASYWTTPLSGLQYCLALRLEQLRQVLSSSWRKQSIKNLCWVCATEGLTQYTVLVPGTRKGDRSAGQWSRGEEWSLGWGQGLDCLDWSPGNSFLSINVLIRRLYFRINNNEGASRSPADPALAGEVREPRAGEQRQEEGEEGGQAGGRGLEPEGGHPQLDPAAPGVHPGQAAALDPVRERDSGHAAGRAGPAGGAGPQTAAEAGAGDGNLPHPGGALRAVFRRADPTDNDKLRGEGTTAGAGAGRDPDDHPGLPDAVRVLDRLRDAQEPAVRAAQEGDGDQDPDPEERVHRAGEAGRRAGAQDPGDRAHGPGAAGDRGGEPQEQRGEPEEDEQHPEGRAGEAAVGPAAQKVRLQSGYLLMDESEATGKAPLVIDNGSGFIKAGISWEEKPKLVCPNLVGRPKYKAVLQTSSQAEIFVGDSLEREIRGVMKLRHPMRHGVIENLKDMDLVWKHVYSALNLNSREYPVLLTEASLNPQANRLAMCDHFFKHYNVPALFVAAQGILSLFATGKTTGVVLDSGDGVTHVVPVYEGYCLQHACERIDLGGRDVTEHLVGLLRKAGYNFHTSAEFEIVRQLKEKKCSVSQPQTRVDDKKPKEIKDKYVLPDSTVIELSSEKSAAPEILFAPEKAGLEYPSIPDLLNNCLSKVDIDLRKAFYGDIVLAGGNTLFENFTERLIGELKRKDTKVRVFAPPNRETMCWSGGANISNLSFFKSMWITKKEFEEEGVRIVLRKTL